MNDLDVIKEIEKLVGVKLEEIEEIKWNSKGYSLNAEGQVRGLALYDCNIKNPKKIIYDLKELKSLTNLNLRVNQISDISPIRELMGLTELILSENQISDISAIEGLKSLTNLNLSVNQISNISPIRELMGLTELDLRKNQISDISPIRELMGLTELDLSKNQISDISAIEELKSLTRLYLGENKISDISPIRELMGLTELILYENQISDISPLGELMCLTELYLDGNQISDISPLGELKCLTELYLDGNQISDISPLRKLLEKEEFEFDIDYNPIITPPIEIVKQGKKAIVEYFIGLDVQGEKNINEVKVLLVGHGEVGKTTLVNCLTGGKPNPNEAATHQIRITPNTIRVDQKNIKLNFWDFGGQEVMHSTHQFFLSSRSLYMLVLDGRMDEDPEYWLKHIESFGGNSPVFVVINKADTNPAYDVNRQFLKKKYPFIRDFYKTICTPYNISGIEKLKKDLMDALDDVKILNSAWPANWFGVKEELEEMKEDFISQIGFEILCGKHEIYEPESREILAEFLNDLGVVVHFKEMRLCDLHILQPRWASRAAYKIINSKTVADNHGLLDFRNLAEIMKKQDENDFEYSTGTYPYVLDLMQKFELCYPIEDGKQYLIPELMDIQQPILPEPEGKLLRFFFKYEDLLPRSVLTRFIVRMHEDIKDDLRWRTGVVLTDQEFKSTAIIISDVKERKINITISGNKRREHFGYIRKTFRDLHRVFEKLTVAEWVPVPGYEEHAIEYEELIGYEENGREEYFIGKLNKGFLVKELLDGIEPENVRKQQYKWDVFLCHSSKDKTIIREIAKTFKFNGISFWLDEEQINYADSIIDKINEGLQQSRIIIPCFSLNQLKSGWARAEYQSILHRVFGGKTTQKVAPLYLNDLPEEKIPILISPIKAARFNDNEDFGKFIEFLRTESHDRIVWMNARDLKDRN